MTRKKAAKAQSDAFIAQFENDLENVKKKLDDELIDNPYYLNAGHLMALIEAAVMMKNLYQNKLNDISHETEESISLQQRMDDIDYAADKLIQHVLRGVDITSQKIRLAEFDP
jgi:hypothetical protein